MSNELTNALTAVAERLLAMVGEDAELQARLRRLAQAVVASTGELDQQPPAAVAAEREPIGPAETFSSTPVNEAATAAVRQPLPLQAIPVVEPSPPLPELTLGRLVPSEEPVEASFPARWRTTGDEDLPVIEARCRLKAEGARWAEARRRLMAEGVDFAIQVAPKDRDIISRAKMLPDCFLWMCHPSGPVPTDGTLYENVAGCFDAVAAILALLAQIHDDPDSLQAEWEGLLELLAEAQSALRVAIAAIDGPSDTDQMAVFNWLKATTAERQVYIQRYMRAGDPADPKQWPELSARIAAVGAQLQDNQRRMKQRRKLLGKVRHRASLIAENPETAREQWEILAAVVEEVVTDNGLPPSNRELRELLVPIIDSLPDLPELPNGFQRVLREIDLYMATSPQPETTSVSQPTPQVQEVAGLLNGRSLVLIGGDRRPASYQAIKDAFGLRELFWIETREHESIDGFEPSIARPEVAAVLLAIRWSSHSFAEVKAFCDRHGKPLVRLPAGYNPKQVAAQIMAQCSERLRANGTSGASPVR